MIFKWDMFFMMLLFKYINIMKNLNFRMELIRLIIILLRLIFRKNNFFRFILGIFMNCFKGGMIV